MAHEQVALPMPRHRPIRHLRWTLVDADNVLDGLRLEPYLAGAPESMPLAEIADQLPFECAPREDVEIGVDGFVRDPHRRLIRIPLRQPSRNLFGGPALREQGEDRRSQAGMDCQRPWLARPMRPTKRPLVGPHRPIGHGRGVDDARARVTGCLGLGSAPVRRSGGCVPRGQHATQLLALHEAQSSIPCHVQLLCSWIDQDTGVALGP